MTSNYRDIIKAELQKIDLYSGNNGVKIDDESLSLLQKAEIDLSIDIPSPPPVLYQGEKVMISKGDFSVVVGAAKSRKTFCVSAMVGAYLCTDEYMNMSSPNDAGNVLWIDTEQSSYHAAKVAKRVCRIAGLPTNQKTERFRMLCFREYEPGKRRELTDKAIRLYRPSLVVVDGAADLILDVNDSAESAKLATMFMDITKEMDNHIVTVLHTNPGGDKPRGHLGTNFLNKAQALFIVRADGDISTVSVERCRDIAVDDFAFAVSKEGLPVLASIPEKSDKIDNLKAIFCKYTQPIRLNDLKDTIISENGIKDSMAYRRIREAKTAGVLIENNVGMLYYKEEEATNEMLPF
ncbi:AAA family ATPase [Parabacteroides sp.]